MLTVNEKNKALSLELHQLMIEIDTRVLDVIDDELEISGKNRDTYNLFIRVIEFYQATILNLSYGYYAVASSMLRPMSEAYIYLRESIADESFAEKFTHHSLNERAKWLDKLILDHGSIANLKTSKEEYQAVLDKTKSQMTDLEKMDAAAKRLFLKHGGADIYYFIYSTASQYVHPNRMSFTHYQDKSGKPIAFEDRDYRMTMLQVGAAACYLTILSLEAFYGSLGNLLDVSTSTLDYLREQLKNLEQKHLGDIGEESL